ncbi:hypothetical protein VTL71DRAFT_13744 [Oculimacula yallundae]|uniref:C2 domain-containing protein n=1 Tax=Oculimacula yallundae TaxID=86028 RepID=A0ABR4CN66_9HELO
MSGSYRGDLSDLIEKGWKNYKVLSQAPPQLKPLSNAVLSIIGVLRLTNDAIQESKLSATEQWVIKGQKTEYSSVFDQLEIFIYCLRSRQSGYDGASAIETKILDLVDQNFSFLEVLQSSLKQDILNALGKILDVNNIAADWEDMQSELKKLGLSERLIQENFFFIDNWLKENFSQDSDIVKPPDNPQQAMKETARGLAAVRLEDDDEELPDYTPGATRGTIEEKVQSLEQTTMVMNHSEPVESMATSSKAPPGYTFESGHDEQVDQDFNRYIKEAIDNEASRRAVERIQNQNAEGHVVSWLPKAMQSEYRARRDIVPLLEANSFSVMGHQTAPRCNDEIERLMSLLRVTFEHKNLSQSVGVVNDAFRCLDSMSKAISKFMLLQDQHAVSPDRFSDMDALDFEYSTAAACGTEHVFPTQEYEYCQKSFYRVLTYIMGMLEAFAYIFQGRTYISRSRHELETLWKDKNMDMRTAWIDKQLAGWDEVEQTLLHIRDWRAVRPIIRDEALKALGDWQAAEKILSGSEPADVIEITIISASGFPKTTFGRPPSLTAEAVLYVASRFGQTRVFELKTNVCKSQNPVWDRSIDITIPKDAKFIDIVVWDRVTGFESQIGRARIPFLLVPGVEANFAEKSLMYGFDEELEFPVPPIGKGKEVRSPTIKLRLRWKGRLARLEAAKLPSTPPGKMFKPNPMGIPLSQDEREALDRQDQAPPTLPRPSNVSHTSEGSGFGGRAGSSAHSASLHHTSSHHTALTGAGMGGGAF